MKKPYAFLLIFLSAMITMPVVFAEAGRSQITSLEQFAIRQYERGDRESALKQFGWILRIEPDNAIAQEYLRKISDGETPSSTPAAMNRDQVITDISNASQDLTRYEQDTKELERLIRDLITENDALYQVVYKRSREVAEMRHKFYGTPYEKAYLDALKSVPIDRVPQRLHRAEDILPAKPVSRVQTAKPDDAAPSKRDIVLQKNMDLAEKNTQLNRLKDELTGINIDLKQSNNRYVDALRQIDAYYSRIKEQAARKNYTEQKMFSELAGKYASKLKEINDEKIYEEKIDDALQSKRDMILQKNTAMAEKNNNLTRLKDTLTDINSGLKQSNNRYVDALRQIDAYYGRIKEQSARKNYSEQKRFSELLHDYALKLKDIAELRKSIEARENELATFKPNIQVNNDRLDNINSQLNTKDSEIARLKAEADTYKQQLAERDAKLSQRNDTIRAHETVIQDQKHDLTMTENKLNDINSDVADIEQELKNGDARLTQLKQTIAQAKKSPRTDPADQSSKDEAIRVKNDLQRIKNDLEQTRSDLQLAKNDIATANTAMSRMNAHKEELLTQKQALGKEASGLRQMILDMTSQLTASARKLANANAVKTNIAKKDQRIAELSERTAILEQELRNLHPATNIRKAQGSDGDLEARLRNSYDKLTATEKELSRSTSLIAELKERLAQLENAGETLKTAPIKANAEKKLLVDALLSKEQELAAVKEQLKDLQRKRNGLAMENNSPSTEKELSGTKEPYVSPEIPQDAISVMIHDRDIKIATLSMQVQALKEELAAKKIIRKEDLTKADDTFPAKATADEGLSVTNEKMDKSQARTKELISDIKTAKTTIKKNSRSSDEDLGELHRLMTLLDRERAELRALQIQIENEVKKARPAAKKNPRMSLMDCFTGCAPTAP